MCEHLILDIWESGNARQSDKFTARVRWWHRGCRSWWCTEEIDQVWPFKCLMISSFYRLSLVLCISPVTVCWNNIIIYYSSLGTL